MRCTKVDIEHVSSDGVVSKRSLDQVLNEISLGELGEIDETEASESITDSLVDKDDDECDLCKIAQDLNNP